MPILWRYLLIHYLKVLSFCVVSFIAILLTTRLQEIAQFAALGAQGKTVLWFTLYQIPYILPIALPISCLISAMILIQGLSSTHELTALRAAGISLRNIFIPILLMAFCLALFNFYIVSEVATSSHFKSRLLERELRSVNPLLLIENQQLTKLKGIHVQNMGSSRRGEFASDVVIGLINKKNHRISLMIAKELHSGTEALKGNKVSLINSMNPTNRESFDHLMIENLRSTTIPILDFSHMLKQQGSRRIPSDYLKLSLLHLRASEDKMLLSQPAIQQDIPQQNFLKKRITRARSETLRRLSIAFAPLTFTLLGIAFGVTIGRHTHYRGVAWVISLATLYLLAYFIAKGIDDLLLPSALLYLLPHILIVAISLRTLKRVSGGVE